MGHGKVKGLCGCGERMKQEVKVSLPEEGASEQRPEEVRE